jgi:hypothetical protein
MWRKRCVKDYENGFLVLSILDNVPAWGEIARNEFFGPNIEPDARQFDRGDRDRQGRELPR